MSNTVQPQVSYQQAPQGFNPFSLLNPLMSLAAIFGPMAFGAPSPNFGKMLPGILGGITGMSHDMQSQGQPDFFQQAQQIQNSPYYQGVQEMQKFYNPSPPVGSVPGPVNFMSMNPFQYGM